MNKLTASKHSLSRLLPAAALRSLARGGLVIPTNPELWFEVAQQVDAMTTLSHTGNLLRPSGRDCLHNPINENPLGERQCFKKSNCLNELDIFIAKYITTCFKVELNQ